MSTPTQHKKTGHRVLAVDPGFDRVGVAILEDGRLLYSGCIVTNRKDRYERRLAHIGEETRKLIEEWQPQALAMETLFFNQNTSTAMKVAEARGLILYEAAKAGLVFCEYSPQAIKIAVTGYGRATKSQIESMVIRLLKMPAAAKKLDDEMDAIALGITHLACRRDI